MSFLLTCPNCGPRDVSEFRYGGQVLVSRLQTAPPSEGQERSEATGSNLPGLQRERWYHRFGCRCWIIAERNVRTNDVLRAGWLAGTTFLSGGDAP